MREGDEVKHKKGTTPGPDHYCDRNTRTVYIIDHWDYERNGGVIDGVSLECLMCGATWVEWYRALGAKRDPFPGKIQPRFSDD